MSAFAHKVAVEGVSDPSPWPMDY